MATFQPLGDDRTLQPANLDDKTEKASEALTDKDRLIDQVATHKIREMNQAKKAKVDKEVVRFNVKDDSGATQFRIGLKANDVARVLHVDTAGVEKLVKSGQFDAAIPQSIKEELFAKAKATHIRESIVDRLPDFGLTLDEFEEIEKFYDDFMAAIAAVSGELTKADFISRHEPELEGTIPRSLIYKPDEPGKGLYILMKEHNLDAVGRGSFNIATIALHIDTGIEKIFRTGRADHISKNELYANTIASHHPEHFAAGFPVEYKGSWRSRKDVDKRGPREEDVPKIGFIMDRYQNELFKSLSINDDIQIELESVSKRLENAVNLAEIDRLEIELKGLQAKPRLTVKQLVLFCCEYAEKIAALHDLGLVHRDQKPENTFLTADNHLRLADFGYCQKEGAVSMKLQGTRGYIPPEVVKDSMFRVPHVISKRDDIWSMGSVLADISRGGSWVDATEQQSENWNKMLNPYMVETCKEQIFQNRDDPNHPDSIINRCLELDPTRRPTAREVATTLRDIYSKL